MDVKFYICKKCGKIIEMIKPSPCPTMCCGEAMAELVPGTSDGAHEKHVPSYIIKDQVVSVQVGEVEHPMLDAHYIEWIAVQTNNGLMLKELKPGDAPKASFLLSEGEKVEAVYAYCNLHSLWKA